MDVESHNLPFIFSFTAGNRLLQSVSAAPTTVWRTDRKQFPWSNGKIFEKLPRHGADSPGLYKINKKWQLGSTSQQYGTDASVVSCIRSCKLCSTFYILLGSNLVETNPNSKRVTLLLNKHPGPLTCSLLIKLLSKQ